MELTHRAELSTFVSNTHHILVHLICNITALVIPGSTLAAATYVTVSYVAQVMDAASPVASAATVMVSLHLHLYIGVAISLSSCLQYYWNTTSCLPCASPWTSHVPFLFHKASSGDGLQQWDCY